MSNTTENSIPDIAGAALSLKTRCLISGGGPSGLMLGLLLARAGVAVLLVERHEDFRRDFRGDTIHPSTLQVMAELGLLEEMLAIPHTRAPRLFAEIDGREICIADFTRLPTGAKYLAFMPQWEFLTFLANKAACYPEFKIMMGASVVGVVRRDDVVTGAVVEQDGIRREIESDLVVAADGRRSILRKLADLPVRTFGAPRDVVWFWLPKYRDDPRIAMTHAGPRQGVVLIDRDDFWQCGYVVGKGGFETLASGGFESFKASVAKSVPFLSNRLELLRDRSDLHLLSIRIDRLERWWVPGLLFIGDAAHAMSPIGGVGVNLAIQDAVAAANILAPKLRLGHVRPSDLAMVEKRRVAPTRLTQKLQTMMQGRARASDRPQRPPVFMRAIARLPIMPHIAGRIIGLGFRPEHVRP